MSTLMSTELYELAQSLVHFRLSWTRLDDPSRSSAASGYSSSPIGVIVGFSEAWMFLTWFFCILSVMGSSGQLTRQRVC